MSTSRGEKSSTLRQAQGEDFGQALPEAETIEPTQINGVSLKGTDAAIAGQWTLMWWRFRKHKLAMISGVLVLLIYLCALFAEFLAPMNSEQVNSRYTFAPPQKLHLFHTDAAGATTFLPHVTGYKVEIDRVAIRRIFVADPTQVIPVQLFAKTEPYLLMGYFPMERKLLAPAEKGQPLYLFGADRLGRDMLSRLLVGARISMSIGLVGVA
ncbi:MAG: hypothetical protein ACRC7G_06360, partial [Beijerinckiaceae bacterium]